MIKNILLLLLFLQVFNTQSSAQATTSPITTVITQNIISTTAPITTIISSTTTPSPGSVHCNPLYFNPTQYDYQCLSYHSSSYYYYTNFYLYNNLWITFGFSNTLSNMCPQTNCSSMILWSPSG